MNWRQFCGMKMSVSSFSAVISARRTVRKSVLRFSEDRRRLNRFISEKWVVKEKWIFWVLINCTVSLKLFGCTSKSLETLGVYNLKMNRALVKTVENRYDVRHLNPSRMRINHLLSEWVSIVIIDKEVWTKPVA
jgi:hypothetical protein